jgi:copper chaperone CopZ
MKKVKLSIEGMHCGSCAGNIERSIRKIEGINEVSVSSMTNKAIVEAEDSVSEEALTSAVKDAGYKVVGIK